MYQRQGGGKHQRRESAACGLAPNRSIGPPAHQRRTLAYIIKEQRVGKGIAAVFASANIQDPRDTDKTIEKTRFSVS
uniref:Uncharacterized protein n=1 Tax=Oryza glumipatula TaxID=40148 RepID=A0A0D9YCU3_9ORYZ